MPSSPETPPGIDEPASGSGSYKKNKMRYKRPGPSLPRSEASDQKGPIP